MRKQILFAAVAALGAGALMAEKQPFERYQTIIDRMPFGQPPPGFDPNRNPDEVSRNEFAASGEELTQEQEAIQKAVQFSVINVEADGVVRVGFSDRSDPSSPRHYYMAVGEERGGWLVKEADAAAKTMTVVKDEVEVELKLGDSTQGADAKGGRARGGTGVGRRGAPVPGARSSNVMTRSSLLSRGGAEGGASTAMGRRERRLMAEREQLERAEQLEAEAKRRAEEEAARREEDKAAREAERAEQREQLAALQEELRRQREEREKNKKNTSDEGEGSDGGEGDAEEGGESDE